MKTRVRTQVTIELSGDEAGELCRFLYQSMQRGFDSEVVGTLLATLQEIPDDNEEVHPR